MMVSFPRRYAEFNDKINKKLLNFSLKKEYLIILFFGHTLWQSLSKSRFCDQLNINQNHRLKK